MSLPLFYFVISLCLNGQTPSQPMIIDLSHQTSSDSWQSAFNNFIQSKQGKLVIYYSFGSATIEHQQQSATLIVKMEQELSHQADAKSETEYYLCSKQAINSINWFFDTNSSRSTPPILLIEKTEGCSIQAG